MFPNALPTNSPNFNPVAGSVSLNIASKDFRTPYTGTGDVAIPEAAYFQFVSDRFLYLESRPASHFGRRHQYWRSGAGGYLHHQGRRRKPDRHLHDAGNVRGNRVDPRYARINIIDAGLNSWYNAGALQLEKRMAHGVFGSLAYTWSHAIDEGQGGAAPPTSSPAVARKVTSLATTGARRAPPISMSGTAWSSVVSGSRNSPIAPAAGEIPGEQLGNFPTWRVHIGAGGNAHRPDTPRPRFPRHSPRPTLVR